MLAHNVVLEEMSPGRSRSFGMLTCKNVMWNLTHLDPFAFQFEVELDFYVTVVVFFSCHCFTHGLNSDTRLRSDIPADEIYDDGRELRVLCAQGYELSRRLAGCRIESSQTANHLSRRMEAQLHDD
ncbi:hypothetical protein BUMB_00416c [Candidatus Paraburkholderia calva]|nr:hypothetical protein BUMB_00416c [Candidatus Paraburkholderia calva]